MIYGSLNLAVQKFWPTSISIKIYHLIIRNVVNMSEGIEGHIFKDCTRLVLLIFERMW